LKRRKEKKKKINQGEKEIKPCYATERICGRETFCFLHSLVILFSHLANNETPDPF